MMIWWAEVLMSRAGHQKSRSISTSLGYFPGKFSERRGKYCFMKEHSTYFLSLNLYLIYWWSS